MGRWTIWSLSHSCIFSIEFDQWTSFPRFKMKSAWNRLIAWACPCTSGTECNLKKNCKGMKWKISTCSVKKSFSNFSHRRTSISGQIQCSVNRQLRCLSHSQLCYTWSLVAVHSIRARFTYRRLAYDETTKIAFIYFPSHVFFPSAHFAGAHVFIYWPLNCVGNDGWYDDE